MSDAPVNSYIVLGIKVKIDDISLCKTLGWTGYEVGQMASFRDTLHGPVRIVGMIVAKIRESFTECVVIDPLPFDEYGQEVEQELLKLGFDAPLKVFLTTYGVILPGDD